VSTFAELKLLLNSAVKDGQLKSYTIKHDTKKKALNVNLNVMTINIDVKTINISINKDSGNETTKLP